MRTRGGGEQTQSWPLLVLAMLAWSLSGAVAQAAPEQTGPKERVVYHINYDDPQRQELALYSIQNHLRAVGVARMDVLVVVHGSGVGLLRRAIDDYDTQAMVLNLRHQGVAFKVCGATLERKELDYETDLFEVDKEDIVPNGVMALARLQAAGYQYLKP